MYVHVVVECPIILAKCINNGSEGQFINHGDPLDAVSKLTLGADAQRGLRYLVCVSVIRKLTSRVIIRATNEHTYSAAGESQTICVMFSENASLQS